MVRKLGQDVLSHLSIERLIQKKFLGRNLIEALDQVLGDINVFCWTENACHSRMSTGCQLYRVCVRSFINSRFCASQGCIDVRSVCFLSILYLKCEMILCLFIIFYWKVFKLWDHIIGRLCWLWNLIYKVEKILFQWNLIEALFSTNPKSVKVLLNLWKAFIALQRLFWYWWHFDFIFKRFKKVLGRWSLLVGVVLIFAHDHLLFS